MTYNAGDEEQVKDRKVYGKQRQKIVDEMMIALLDMPQGRMLVWDLLESTKVFHSSFSSRALEMAFNEGQRNVGLRLMADIMRLAPEQWAKMSRENGEQNERSSIRLQRAQPGAGDPSLGADNAVESDRE